MLFYGLGLGVRTVAGYLAKLQDLDALRPPHTSATYFKRRMSSENWRPMPFGSEGQVGPQIYTLPAAHGAIAVSAQPVRLLRSGNIKAESGSLTISMQSAALTRQKTMAAAQGAVAISGQPAVMRGSRILRAEQAAVSVSGQDAGLFHSYALVAEQSSAFIAGQDAALTYVGIPSIPVIPAIPVGGVRFYMPEPEEKPISVTVLLAGVGAVTALRSVSVETTVSISDRVKLQGVGAATAFRSVSVETTVSISARVRLTGHDQGSAVVEEQKSPASPKAKVYALAEYRTKLGGDGILAENEEDSEEFAAIMSILFDMDIAA